MKRRLRFSEMSANVPSVFGTQPESSIWNASGILRWHQLSIAVRDYSEVETTLCIQKPRLTLDARSPRSESISDKIVIGGAAAATARVVRANFLVEGIRVSFFLDSKGSSAHRAVRSRSISSSVWTVDPSENAAATVPQYLVLPYPWQCHS